MPIRPLPLPPHCLLLLCCKSGLLAWGLPQYKTVPSMLIRCCVHRICNYRLLQQCSMQSYWKYPMLKISDIYREYISSIYIMPTLVMLVYRWFAQSTIRARARNIHRLAQIISYIAQIIRSQRDNIVQCPPLQQGWCSLLDQPCTA